MEKLISSLTAERDQLTAELQENIRMVRTCSFIHLVVLLNTFFSPLAVRFISSCYDIFHFIFRKERDRCFSSVFRMIFTTRDRSTQIWSHSLNRKILM